MPLLEFWPNISSKQLLDLVAHLNSYNVIYLFKALGAIYKLHGCITFDKIEIQLAKRFMLLAGRYVVFPLCAIFHAYGRRFRHST